MKPISFRHLLHNQPFEPQAITTDGPASCGTALDQPDQRCLNRPGQLRESKRIEKPHLPIRRREHWQQRFRSQAADQTFLTTHAAINDPLNIQRHQISKPTLRLFQADAAPARAAAVV